VGKSTLLNTLLNEECAIVSHVAGTTRDSIEDEIVIGGIGFRFIDTAGIRETEDVIETIGIQKTFENIEKAQVVIYLADAFRLSEDRGRINDLNDNVLNITKKYPQKPILLLLNKADKLTNDQHVALEKELPSALFISAKTKEHMEDVTASLLNLVNAGALKSSDPIVTNTRHYSALLKALEEITKVQQGVEAGISGDLLSIDIRQALYHFGEITGEITSDDLLGNIFANFCIGK
jgi:tRNA modification GTPase